jgi:hypothetical protein
MPRTQEIQRGAVRTVDYVNQIGNGAMLKLARYVLSDGDSTVSSFTNTADG